MSWTLDDLNETVLQAKEHGAIHFKSVDCPLVQKWARRNLASQHSRREIETELFGSVVWMPDAKPESERNKDPHQMFWLVTRGSPTYKSAQYEAEQIRAMARAALSMDQRTYDKIREDLEGRGYDPDLLDEIPRPE